MAILSRQSINELRRIIKEATGRDLSLGEAYAIWGHLIKLLQLLWAVENRNEAYGRPHQPNLFRRKGRRGRP